jgi:3-oxoacyl-[acyl-carrier-protein] synthase II
MARSEPRVVITGMGLISPLGNSASDLWSAVSSGRSGVRPLRSLPRNCLPISVGAEAWDFTGAIEDFGTLDKQTVRSVKKGLKVMCREIQMGVAAAQRALADSELTADKRDPERTGVSYGSDYLMTVPEEFILGVRHCLNAEGEFEFSRWARDGMSKIDPLWLLKYLPNMPASHIAIFNDLRGPNNSVTLRETSGNLAIAEAYYIIQRGLADSLIAGATGTRVHPLRTVHVVMQEEVCQSELPAEQQSRPFDRDRAGMVLGEGAAAIVVERYEHAASRGARILGELVGYGASTVADRGGKGNGARALVNAMRRALVTAELNPAEIGHIHAHGISTVQGDRAEAEAISEVFGETRVPVTAAKSYFGNPGASGGVLELIVSLLAFQHQQLPPVLNFENPDSDCPLEICRTADVSPGDSVMNLSLTPQGQANALIVRRAS